MTHEVKRSESEARLDDLYQEVILDHNRRPRNFGKLENADVCVHGVNPRCGDDYHLYLKKNIQGIVEAIQFEGDGCAISKASASLMTTEICGKSLVEARRLKDAFIRLLTSADEAESSVRAVGKLRFFKGVKQFPIRVKCATLIWRALEEAIKETPDARGEVSTEK